MSTPKAINPVGNKIPFSVTTSNHLDQAGRNAELRFTIGAAGFSNGSNLKLDFIGQIWQFDFVDFPDDSGLQLTCKVLALPFADWFAVFIEEVKYNRYIYPYYTISTTNGDTIVFTARKFGEIYTMKIAESNPAATNEVRLPGLDELIKTNFGIIAQTIERTSSGEELILGTDRIAGNDVEFDVKNYLALSVNSKMNFPQSVDNWKIAHTEAVKTFFIRYWERAGNYIGKIQNTNEFKVITGGLTKIQEQLIFEDAINYIDLIKSGDILIQTNRPLLSKIAFDEPVRFYFVNHYTEQKTFTANILIKYTDTTSLSPVLSFGNSIILEPDVQGCFLIGPTLHSFKEINPEKIISTIEFNISADEESLKSETFILELKDSLFPRGLIFQNSFNVWETASFFGTSQLNDTYTRLFFEALSTKILTKVTENEKLQLNSGWLYKQERDWLRDLILSKEVYLINESNLFRVNILNNEFLRHTDNIYLYSLQLEIELTGDNKYYSNKTATGFADGLVIGDDNFIIGDDNIVIGY